LGAAGFGGAGAVFAAFFAGDFFALMVFFSCGLILFA
jgi:hypothetical protein